MARPLFFTGRLSLAVYASNSCPVKIAVWPLPRISKSLSYCSLVWLDHFFLLLGLGKKGLGQRVINFFPIQMQKKKGGLTMQDYSYRRLRRLTYLEFNYGNCLKSSLVNQTLFLSGRLSIGDYKRPL